MGLELEYCYPNTTWKRTLFTQMVLCVALYLALNIGTPHISNLNTQSSPAAAHDLYFISVSGVHRPPWQLNRLLKLMDKVAKIFKVKFVINTSEYGEDDPLHQNGTLNFQALKVPWYSTGTSKGQGMGYFLQHIMLTHGQTLDIIGLNTGFLHDCLHREKSCDAKNSWMQWLRTTLASSNGNWCLVVGYHPLMVCQGQQNTVATIKVFESLDQIFLQYRVNAYLSKQGCSSHYTSDEGIAYIGNPDHTYNINTGASMNETTSFPEDKKGDGFLLHRVSPLEIVSYLINSSGEVILISTLHQRGKAVM